MEPDRGHRERGLQDQAVNRSGPNPDHEELQDKEGLCLPGCGTCRLGQEPQEHPVLGTPKPVFR